MKAAIARSLAAPPVAQPRSAEADRAVAPHVQAALVRCVASQNRPLGRFAVLQPATAGSKHERDDDDEEEEERNKKKQRKSLGERLEERKLKEQLNKFGAGGRSGTRNFQQKKEFLATPEGAERAERLEQLALEKPSAPTKDKFGNEIWNGFRKGLDFGATFRSDWWLAHQVKVNGNELAVEADLGYYVCELQLGGCKADSPEQGYKGRLSIDHMEEASINLHLNEPYEICDGEHHWLGFLKGKAPEHPCTPSEERPTILEIYCNEANLQASCKHCNSSKSGEKGRDGSPPDYLGECPGVECGYTNPT